MKLNINTFWHFVENLSSLSSLSLASLVASIYKQKAFKFKILMFEIIQILICIINFSLRQNISKGKLWEILQQTKNHTNRLVGLEDICRVLSILLWELFPSPDLNLNLNSSELSLLLGCIDILLTYSAIPVSLYLIKYLHQHLIVSKC